MAASFPLMFTKCYLEILVHSQNEILFSCSIFLSLNKCRPAILLLLLAYVDLNLHFMVLNGQVIRLKLDLGPIGYNNLIVDVSASQISFVQ